MAKYNSRATTIAISLTLMFAMAISLVVVPNASAQAATKTYAFIGATPNPVGVGQQVLLHVGDLEQTVVLAPADQQDGLALVLPISGIGLIDVDTTGRTGPAVDNHTQIRQYDHTPTRSRG